MLEVPRGVSVLIVDDDVDLLDSLRAMLETCDFQVTCAPDAAAAIRHVAETPPDLVITDIYMPGQDGFQLIDALRNTAAELPVVAMSGGSRKGPVYGDLDGATHVGAMAVIDKPFTFTCLVETIGRVLARNGNGNGRGNGA